VSANADLPSSSGSSGGGLAVYKMSKKGGAHLKAIGMEQMAMSTQSMPARREWTNLTKAQHKELRLVSPTNPMAGESVSKKRFDYKPAGTKRGATKRQDAHFRRQPRTGKYSQVSPGKVKIHRAKKFTRGATTYGAGKLLPILGLGVYFYDVARSDDPATKIVKDVMWSITNPMEFGRRHIMFDKEAAVADALSIPDQVERSAEELRRILPKNPYDLGGIFFG